MNNILSVFCTAILILIIESYSFSQPRSQLKEIRAKGNYIHNKTSSVFPENVGIFKRSGIFSWDKDDFNIGANYDYKNNAGSTTVSVYIYPAEEATEDRLRNEYFTVMQTIANNNSDGIHAVQHMIYYKFDNYRINGIKAELLNEELREHSNLVLYECGEWFFKIRLTTNIFDTSTISQIEQRFLEIFNPTDLVKISKLDSKANVYFNKTSFADSILLGSAMGAAYKKLEWAFENVDSLERCSGFPGLYLGLHIEALKAFINFEKEHDFPKQQSTIDYLTELNSIIDAGFIEEFVMDQYDWLIFMPEDIIIDFANYQKWKQTHPIKINLREKFYIVSFGKRED